MESDGFKNLRILIVDDMPAVRSILRDMLNSAGSEHIDEVEDADSAWENLSTSRGLEFDLLLLDVVLPGMSGLDLVRAVRSNPHFNELRILMVTSEGRLDHVGEAVRCGANGYLVKPFTDERLIEVIGALFGRK